MSIHDLIHLTRKLQSHLFIAFLLFTFAIGSISGYILYGSQTKSCPFQLKSVLSEKSTSGTLTSGTLLKISFLKVLNQSRGNLHLPNVCEQKGQTQCR